MIQFLLSFWQFPQHLLATLMLVWFVKKQRIRESFHRKHSDIFVINDFPGGCSLGPVIFVYGKDENMVKHELGHARQSMFLGPLYLLVVGIPSLVWNRLWRPSWKRDYYWFYTERWADRLGGVKRNS